MDFRAPGGKADIRTRERPDLFTDEETESFLRDYFRDTGHLEEYESGEFFMTEEMEDAIESLSPSEHRSWDSLPDAVKRRIMMKSLRKAASKYKNDIFLNTERAREAQRLTEAGEAKYGLTRQGVSDAKDRLRELEEAVEAEITEETPAGEEEELRQESLRHRYEKAQLSKALREVQRAEEALSDPGLSKEEKDRRRKHVLDQYKAFLKSDAFKAGAGEKELPAFRNPDGALTKEEKDESLKRLRIRLEKMMEETEEEDAFLILKEEPGPDDESGMFYSERLKKQLDSLHPERPEEEGQDPSEEDFPRAAGQVSPSGSTGLSAADRRKRAMARQMAENKKGGRQSSIGAQDMPEEEDAVIPGTEGSDEIRTARRYASKAVFFTDDEKARQNFSVERTGTKAAQSAALRKQRAIWQMATKKQEEDFGRKLDGYVVLDRDNEVVWSSECDDQARIRDMDEKIASMQAVSVRQDMARQDAISGSITSERTAREEQEAARKKTAARQDTARRDAINGSIAKQRKKQEEQKAARKESAVRQDAARRDAITSSITNERKEREEYEPASMYKAKAKADLAEEKRQERSSFVAAQEEILIRALRSDADTESDKNTRMKEAIRLQKNAEKRKAVLSTSSHEISREEATKSTYPGSVYATQAGRDSLGETVREIQKTTSAAQSGISLSGKAASTGRQDTSGGKTSDGFYSDMTLDSVSEIISGASGAAGFMKEAGSALLSLGIKHELSREILKTGKKARKKAAQKATAQNEEMQKANQAAEKYLETAGTAAKKAAKTGTLLVMAGKGTSAAVLPFPFKIALAVIGLLVTILLLWLGFHLVDRGGEHAETTTIKTSYSSDNIGDEVVEYAKTFIGVTKYVYGANNFPSQTDCSGFVQGVFKHFGVELNRTTVTMQQDGSLVGTNTLSGAAPGDIVIFNPAGEGRNSHVGIYAGDGKMVDNSSSNGGPVYRDVYQTNNIQVRRVLAGAALTGIEIGNVSNNAEGVYKAFRRAGFTAEGAAAATGNFMHESGLNGHSCEPWNAVSDAAEIKYTEMVNKGFGKTKTSPNWITEYQFIHASPCPDGGYWTSSWGWGYGIAQWTDSGRRTNLYKTYKRLRNKYGSQVSIDSMLVQVSCVIEEGKTNGGNLTYAYNKMKDPSYKGKSGVEALTYIWFDRFEWNTAADHADPDGSFSSRYQNALDCYNKYSKMDPVDDSAPISSGSSSPGNTDLADLKKLLELFGSSVTIEGLEEFVDDYIKNDSGFDNTPGEGNTGGNNGKTANPAKSIDRDPVAKKCNYGYIKGTKAGTLKKSDHNNRRTTFKNTYGLDASLSYFHPGWYFGKITKKGTYDAIDGGDDVKVSKGTTGIIIGHTNWGKKAYFRLANGRTISVKKGRYKVLSILYNSSKAYTNRQVEEWINRQDITGKTRSGYRISPVNKVVLVSKYNQRAWILTGSNHHWKCSGNSKLCGSKCGTVAMWGNTTWSHPNPCYPYANYLACNEKEAICSYGRSKGMAKTRSYVSKGGGNLLHGGGHGYPLTHGCIAFKTAMRDAIYDLALGTPVVVF